MRKKPRFTDRIHSPPRQDRVRDSYVDSFPGYRYLWAALRSRAPGQWSQNLLELSRHFTSSIFLAINTLANQAAAADCKVYERDPEEPESKEQLPHGEPLCRLLEDPNDDDGTPDLLYQVTQQLSLTGISLVWMPRNNPLDIPSELYVIPTATAFPLPQDIGYPQGAYRILPLYPYGPFTTLPNYQSAAGAIVPADQVIRIKNHHPILRYDGYAVLSAISRQIDTVEAIDLARLNTQKQGVDPSIAMGFDPEVFNPDEVDLKRLREQIEAVNAGPENVGKIFFNPYGTTISKLSNTPLEMAWTEGWSQLVDFVLACYGVPKSVAGLQDAVNYATLFAALKQFYLLSLNPLLNKIAGKFNKHLVRPYFGPDLLLQLIAQKITDEDLLEKQLGNDLAGGIRKRNELRKLRDLTPLPGPEGEELVFAGKGKPTGSDDPTPEEKDPTVEQARPRNPQARGSLGPRKALLDAFERHKTNGTIHPIKA
jgi:phage portal protein BeeE